MAISTPLSTVASKDPLNDERGEKQWGGWYLIRDSDTPLWCLQLTWLLDDNGIPANWANMVRSSACFGTFPSGIRERCDLVGVPSLPTAVAFCSSGRTLAGGLWREHVQAHQCGGAGEPLQVPCAPQGRWESCPDLANLPLGQELSLQHTRPPLPVQASRAACHSMYTLWTVPSYIAAPHRGASKHCYAVQGQSS